MVNVIDEPREFANPDDINSQVREYVLVKNSIETLEERKSDLRTSIFTVLDEEGEIDEKGNIFVELSQPVEGYVRVEKTKRVTRKVDEAVAEEILKDRNLEDEIYETVRVVNEDKLMAAFYEGKLDENDLERMYPAKIVWALTPKKK